MIWKAICMVVPGLFFLGHGRFLSGALCLALQTTLMGWPAASLWAFRALHEHEADERIRAAYARNWSEQYRQGRLPGRVW